MRSGDSPLICEAPTIHTARTTHQTCRCCPLPLPSASRLIVKHLRHNRPFPRSKWKRRRRKKGGGGGEVGVGSSSGSKGFFFSSFFFPWTTLLVTMTTNRNLPWRSSAECFSTRMPSLLPSCPHHHHHHYHRALEFGEYTSIFDLLPM